MAPERPRKTSGFIAAGFQDSRPAKLKTTEQNMIPEAKRKRDINGPLKEDDWVRVSMAPIEKKTLERIIAAAAVLGDGLFLTLLKAGIVDVL